MSKREEIARRMFDQLTATGRFNGPVNDLFRSGTGRGSYHGMVLMIPRLLDMYVRVYGERFILLEMRGIGNFKEKFESEELVMDRIKNELGM